MVWSSNHQHLLTLSGDRFARLWSTEGGKIELPGRDRIESGVATPDAGFATADVGGEVVWWSGEGVSVGRSDVGSGAVIVDGDESWPLAPALAVDPDGALLVAAGRRLLRFTEPGGTPTEVPLPADATAVASGSVVGTADGQVLWVGERGVRATARAGDGDRKSTRLNSSHSSVSRMPSSA